MNTERHIRAAKADIPLTRADLVGISPEKLRELFPQGFAFAQARQLFDAWLVQAGDDYNEQAVQAMWIGFAHRICDLYYSP